jgi:citrate lyase subunit beta/citryl-CoA lyase
MPHAVQTALPPAFLYVPADRPERFEKADAAAPAVMLDLEDSVAVDRKAQARANVARHLDGARYTGEQWVRVSSESLELDIQAFAGVAPPAGVMLAKADLDSLRHCGAVLPGVPIVALIESSRALDELRAMTTVETLVTFAIGEVDLLADLRIANTPATAPVIDTLRLEIVRAAAAARLHAPVAPTSLELRNSDSVAESTRRLRDLGFRSRTAIHPAQCPPILEAFRPTPDEVAGARIILDSLARGGGGATVGPDGRFVDAAVIRESNEILARATSTRAETE